MQEAWIQLSCPTCDEQWQENPTELPKPGESFTCDHCEATRTVSEFTKTARDFEMLESFHGA
jgi:hypothetical protein